MWAFSLSVYRVIVVVRQQFADSFTHLSLSRFKLAGPPTTRDTEAPNAYAIIHDLLGPVCICSLIGINSIVREMLSHINSDPLHIFAMVPTVDGRRQHSGQERDSADDLQD
jgi:hypothetical protein